MCLSLHTALHGFTRLYNKPAVLRQRVVTCHDDSRRRNGGTVALFPRSRLLLNEEKRSRRSAQVRRRGGFALREADRSPTRSWSNRFSPSPPAEGSSPPSIVAASRRRLSISTRNIHRNSCERRANILCVSSIKKGKRNTHGSPPIVALRLWYSGSIVSMVIASRSSPSEREHC